MIYAALKVRTGQHGSYKYRLVVRPICDSTSSMDISNAINRIKYDVEHIWGGSASYLGSFDGVDLKTMNIVSVE